MEVKTKADEIVKSAFANHWDMIKTPELLNEAKTLLGVPKHLDLIPSQDNWEKTFGEALRRRTKRALDLAEHKAQQRVSRAIKTLFEFGYGVIPPSQ